MIAYGGSVGGIATPVGTPPNLIGIGMIDTLIGVKLSFFDWMAFALPITVVMFVYLFIVLGGLALVKGGSSRAGAGIKAYVESARAKLGGWKKGEINTAFVFALTVTLWVLPSIVALIIGKEADLSVLLKARLNVGVVAMGSACLLFLLPLDMKKLKFTMTWERAVKIDWGTILLFGGGLSLGKLMFSTGLAEAFGTGL
ncbi:MAG: SLC13 family permease, partial [Thermodesulfobacteriota bacterium]